MGGTNYGGFNMSDFGTNFAAVLLLMLWPAVLGYFAILFILFHLCGV